ncbi:MAG: hypothetical protein M0C28_24465 [Candidatus Moduliflexus flocculans]|nr:hypothetical protein [Candidatus Moduliflexus flocculans]
MNTRASTTSTCPQPPRRTKDVDGRRHGLQRRVLRTARLKSPPTPRPRSRVTARSRPTAARSLRGDVREGRPRSRS